MCSIFSSQSTLAHQVMKSQFVRAQMCTFCAAWLPEKIWSLSRSRWGLAPCKQKGNKSEYACPAVPLACKVGVADGGVITGLRGELLAAAFSRMRIDAR